jgi:DNA repair exonuclease SbcCD ATPase subunit
MTPTRYFFANVAKAFGYMRGSQRTGDAAREMHLLRDAETHLGVTIWENCKDIENLSAEYWNLRRLKKDYDILLEKIRNAESKLETAQSERINILQITPETNEEILNQRSEKLKEIEELAVERHWIITRGSAIRRIHVGLKMKLEALNQESSNPEEHETEIQSVKQRLEAIKNEFTELKNKRIKVGLAIEQGDKAIDALDEQLKNLRQDRRLIASDSFQVISECNKELAALYFESGNLETQMRSLHSEIGRYVSRHYQNDPQCAAASAAHRSLTDVMRELRRSIALNLHLSGRG